MQALALQRLRSAPDEHARLVHGFLAVIYGYVLGYRDSPCWRTADDALEIKLQQAKIVLERELLDHLLNPASATRNLSQCEAVAYLHRLIRTNGGAEHRL